jgi:alpha-galactosidase
LISELRAEFPQVIFENCSSGGGRPDLGMLALMEQTWASDQTDPIDRIFIQYGYLSSFPANTMVCWTTSSDTHKVGVTLEFSFDVAFQGVLGIGNNISNWNKEQREIAKLKIAQYKEIRHLIQGGIVSRLKSPFEGNRVAIQYTADNGKESVVLCYNLGEVAEGATSEVQQSSRLKLESLLSDAIYQVGNSIYTGKYLMDVGLPWPLKRAYKSCVINLRITK